MEKLLPVLIVAESVIAGVIYACAGKFGESIYWLSAGTLNLAVIFLIPGGNR